MFGLLSTFAFTATAMAAFQAKAQVPPGCTRAYTVVPGDVCNGISAAQHVSTFQLAHVNPQIDARCSNLYPYEVLCLGIVDQDCTDTYVVQYEDCPTIASQFGIPLSTLEANNPGGCPPYPGKVLCVSSTIYPYDVAQNY